MESLSKVIYLDVLYLVTVIDVGLGIKTQSTFFVILKNDKGFIITPVTVSFMPSTVWTSVIQKLFFHCFPIFNPASQMRPNGMGRDIYLG